MPLQTEKSARCRCGITTDKGNEVILCKCGVLGTDAEKSARAVIIAICITSIKFAIVTEV